MSGLEKPSAEFLTELEALRARVNELERIEIEYRRAEERLRLAEFSVDRTAMPTVWVGPDARVLRVNDAACRSLGYSRDELASMSVHDFDPDFPPQLWPDHWEELKQRGAMTFESRHRAKDGRVFPVEITVNYLKFGDQEYNFAFVRDITDRKQAEEALRTADRLAAVGTVVAGVAHELNTPLTTICGRADMLSGDRSLHEAARESADMIAQQAMRCGKIVEDLLGVARAGRLSLRSVRINALVKRCLDISRCTHHFDDVEIVEEYAPDIPETTADPYRLEQVFINIIRNAGDALRGAVAVRRLTVRTQRTTDHIRVEFTDTGPGIPDPGRVFDPFYTTKEVAGGTGLGLSVSLGIVQEHGGMLSAANTGRGARFTVTLPVRRFPSEEVRTPGRPEEPNTRRA